MASHTLQPARSCIHWSLLTSIGYAGGFFAGFMLGHVILGNVAIGMSIGLGVSLAQGFLLRDRIKHLHLWLVAGVLGQGVSHAAITLIAWGLGASTDLSWPVGIAMWAIALAGGGAIASSLQTTLFKTHRRHAWHWVLINTIAWAVSVVGLAIPPDYSGSWSGVFLIAVLILRNGLLAPTVAGLLLGILSSIYWLVHREELPAPNNPSSTPSKSHATTTGHEKIA